MNKLHYTLPSGRVLLLNEPLTAEEIEAAKTQEGAAALEALADLIASRSTREITADNAAYAEMLRMHGIRK